MLHQATRDRRCCRPHISDELQEQFRLGLSWFQYSVLHPALSLINNSLLPSPPIHAINIAPFAFRTFHLHLLSFVLLYPEFVHPRVEHHFYLETFGSRIQISKNDDNSKFNQTLMISVCVIPPLYPLYLTHPLCILSHYPFCISVLCNMIPGASPFLECAPFPFSCTLITLD